MIAAILAALVASGFILCEGPKPADLDRIPVETRPIPAAYLPK